MNDEMAPDRDDRPRSRRDDDDYDYDRRPAVTSNGMATAALVLGVLALCGGLTAIPGLICGVIGMSRASSRNGAGYGMAIAGTVLSGFGLLTIIPLMIVLLLPAVQKVRESAARMASTNNLKHLSLAQMTYESANGEFTKPYHYLGPAGGEPEKLSDRLSWRVTLLPYIESDPTYGKFKHHEPWNSPNNRPLADVSIKTLIHPGDAPPSTNTRYRIFYGGAGFDLNRKRNSQGITDGGSNTIAIVEGGDPVTWTQFDEYPFDMVGPLPTLGLPGATVFQAAMFDGSVRTIKKTVDPNVLKRGIHAADGFPLAD